MKKREQLISTKNKSMKTTCFSKCYFFYFFFVLEIAEGLRWAFARPSIQTEYTVGGRAAGFFWVHKSQEAFFGGGVA